MFLHHRKYDRIYATSALGPKDRILCSDRSDRGSIPLEPTKSIMEKKSNVAKGRDSYDSTSTGVMIPFFNRNITPYATEAGGPKFEMVPVTKQKDLMINHARMYAQQEYNRIMELVNVLQQQANQIKRRLEITDAVHAAVYQFNPVMGKAYWLVWEQRKQHTILTSHGPNDWSTGVPVDYEYISRVKYMGDHTWLEIDEEGNPVL